MLIKNSMTKSTKHIFVFCEFIIGIR